MIKVKPFPPQYQQLIQVAGCRLQVPGSRLQAADNSRDLIINRLPLY
jgi:hypothetical protein